MSIEVRLVNSAAVHDEALEFFLDPVSLLQVEFELGDLGDVAQDVAAVEERTLVVLLVVV